MHPFSLLIKPASADCNLRCAYCFYRDRAALYPETSVHRMSGAVLERLIGSFMATDQPAHVFGWQGGEPSLMGSDFFRQVTTLQQRYGRPGAQVSNGFQTNATLITDDLAQLMAQHKFLVGVSLDGPPELHNRYRFDAAGQPSHAQVMQGISTLRQHQVEFNILVLVSAANVKHGRTVYRYLRDQGLCFHQYIPCVEFDADGKPLPFAITGQQWGAFLCDVFDEWIKTDTRKVSVRLFDSILEFALHGSRNVCDMHTTCCQYLLVEHNGDVYPCDFFVRPELKLGNLMEQGWEELVASPLYARFGARKAQIHPVCRTCRYLSLCAGDCQKHRLRQGQDPRQLSWLCAGLRPFYAHTLEAFSRLARDIQQEHG